MGNSMNRDTIGDISRRAATRYRDKTAIIFRDLALSFSLLEKEICRFANLMISLGITKGDRVAVDAYNSHFYPIIFMGLAKIGAVQVPVNYMLNGEEITYIVNHSGSKAFIVEDALFPVIEPCVSKLTGVKHWGFIPLAGTGVPAGFFDLGNEMSKMPFDDPDAEVF